VLSELVFDEGCDVDRLWARSSMPCCAQKAENCRTASMYARRVLRLRMWELKKSRIRFRA
jgi:hypothetical protein